VRARILVDGHVWWEGATSCVLVGNVGTITGGLVAFDDARPDDGMLDIGVVMARGPLQWSRVLGRMVARRASGSPLVRTTRGVKFDVRLARALPYELDGGARDPADRLKVKVDARAIEVCVSAEPRR
jgi:diacylglycerol kinase family enzyme